MARIKKEDHSPRRTAFLGVQLTPDEKSQLQHRAARVMGDKPNMSDFARRILLDDLKKPAARGHDPRAIRALVVALTKVGTNINQLAHVANERGQLPAERVLRDVSAQLVATLEKVVSL